MENFFGQPMLTSMPATSFSTSRAAFNARSPSGGAQLNDEPILLASLVYLQHRSLGAGHDELDRPD